MKKKRTHAEKQRLITQILCLVLAGLMLLGVVMSILPFSALIAHAADEPAETPVTEESVTDDAVIPTEETPTEQPTEEPSPETAEDVPPQTTEEPIPAAPSTEEAETVEESVRGLLLRIGLMFGSGVTESFAVRAEDGFVVHHVNRQTNEATPLFETTVSYAAVTKDANLALDEDGYYYPASKGVVIGGYHLQLPTAYKDQAALTAAVEAVNNKLKTAGIYSSLIYAFPTYNNGGLYVCIGDFGSGSSASDKIALIETATSEKPSGIYPRDNAVTLLAPDSNLILFEYCSSDGEMGLSAREDDDVNKDDPNAVPKENFIITPAKNSYRGIFLFARYENGISVTNLIDLENYVAGVVPWEIGNHWEIDALKAFACIVRSYTLSYIGHHKSLGIDLCNGTDCQVYMGTGKENDAIREAVSSTEGMLVTYNGKPCSAFYSAVTGGCTVNIEQIWNGSAYPYLRAVSTPWEDYASHPNGVWLGEVSGYELYSYLYGKGYKQLQGAIAEINILELAENSTYVYRLELVDIYGVKITLKGTDIIRTALSRYLKSANFVVGHKGNIALLNRVVELMTAEGGAELPITETEEKKTMKVMTADGIKEIDVTEGMSVIQADGAEKVITERPPHYEIPDDAHARLDSGTNNFLFIGKGWGHGGGVSQWGVKNMAEQGYTWEEIIHAYFTDVDIVHYRTLPAYQEK